MIDCHVTLEVSSPAGRLIVVRTSDPGLLRRVKRFALGSAYGACLRWRDDATLSVVAEADLRRLETILDRLIPDEK